MTSILIRAQEADDIEAMNEIMNCPGVIAGTLQIPYQSVEVRRERMAQTMQDVYRLVATLEGRVVGGIALQLERSPRRRHCGDLGMVVHDAFQRRGVGTELLAAVLDLSDNWLGLRRIELAVYTDNAPAIHLYEKFGFAIEGTARQYAFRAGVYVDAYTMARVRA